MARAMGEYGALLDALRGVRWPARRGVSRGAPGAHRSTQRGAGGEFTEYRLYRQGDDARTLDWKLLARSDRPFVRLTDDRAVLPTWLLVDGSASMDFPAGAATSKWRCAKRLAVGLAAVVHASGDPVGVVVVHAGGTTRLPPRTRRGTVQAIAHLLDGCAPGGDRTLTPEVATLARAEGASRVVCITDALSDGEALWRAVTAPLVSGALAECLHVVAAEELAPTGGVWRVQDPEALAERGASAPDDATRVLTAATRSGYDAAFAAFREGVAQRWRGVGAGYTEVSTAHDVARVIRGVVRGG